MKLLKSALLLSALMFTYKAQSAPVPAVAEGPTTFTIDAAHSRVSFDIDHLVISNVEGQFKKFEGEFAYDKKNQTVTHAKILIHAASIDTNEAKRDEHLRGKDFFEVTKYPEITFDQAKLTAKGGKPVELVGNLTMHGKTKPVTLKVEWKGDIVDPWGNKKIVFKLTGDLERKDFDITFNKALDKGGVMVGEIVRLNIMIEANEKTAAKK